MKALILCLVIICQTQRFDKSEVNQDLIAQIESFDNKFYMANIDMIPQIISDEEYDKLENKTEQIDGLLPPIFDSNPPTADSPEIPSESDLLEDLPDYSWFERFRKRFPVVGGFILWSVIAMLTGLFFAGIYFMSTWAKALTGSDNWIATIILEPLKQIRGLFSEVSKMLKNKE